jgi:hypothetical protein
MFVKETYSWLVSVTNKKWIYNAVLGLWGTGKRQNCEWEGDKIGRFKKRHELVWVEAGELLTIYENAPDKLWKRVRQLENLIETVRSIVQSKEP